MNIYRDTNRQNTLDLAIAMAELELSCLSGLLRWRHSLDHRHCGGNMIHAPKTMLRCCMVRIVGLRERCDSLPAHQLLRGNLLVDLAAIVRQVQQNTDQHFVAFAAEDAGTICRVGFSTNCKRMRQAATLVDRVHSQLSLRNGWR